MTSDGTIYNSNGAGHACGYSSRQAYLAGGGTPDTQGFTVYPSFPQVLTYDGTCLVGAFKIVDCTIEGNCWASNQSPSSESYAYAPSITKINGEYHTFFCSTGNSGPDTGMGWDAISYTHSTDGVHWSTPIRKLTASASASRTRDLSACDPAIVYYQGQYYLFYSSAYISPNGNTLTNIQVARSSTIDGTYLTYTDQGTWELSPSNPKMIIRPLSDIPNSYGAGQPTVVAFNGRLRMWYTDTTADLTNWGYHNYMLDSVDPVTWEPSTSAETDAEASDVDVKLDTKANQFVMYTVTSTLNSQTVNIQIARSIDGLHWTPPLSANVPSFPVNYYADNIGASSDEEGHVIPGDPVLIGFNAPYKLSSTLPGLYWGQWNLYGVFLTP